jgi:DNA-binding CsgD family transcriptional regulator
MVRIVLAGLLIFGGCLQSVAQHENDSLIAVLRKEIEHRDTYVNARRHRIEALRTQLTTAPTLPLEAQFNLYNALYHEYKTFIYDSAFQYSKKLIETAYRMRDPSRISYARVKLGFILISSGMFKETFDTLQRVQVNHLPDSSRTDYYRLLSRAYSDLTIYNKDQYYRTVYTELIDQYLDSALLWCPVRSYNYYYLNAVRSLHVKEYEATIQYVDTLLRTHQLNNPQLAVNYFDLGNAWQALDEPAKTIRFQALSSISDLRAATKETAAMHSLAKVLFDQGDVENAYIFIQQALDDAEFYGARQRKVQIGSILPVIASAHLNRVDEQRRVWLQYAVALTVLALVVIAFAFIIYKQLQRLKVAELRIREANRNLQNINHRLLEADKIKEEYIGYYFSNNSNYIDKIESFKKSLDLKLQHKKVEDIKYLVSTINPGLDREELYVNFDKIFLKLFPDFITIFNSYFAPEDRLVLKEGQLLNTELRIFALIRLGIHDAEKIARILGYSVNTIYSYKNRVKSKSIIANELFEEKIMEINSLSFIQQEQ